MKRIEERIDELETRDAEIDETMALSEVCTDYEKCTELSLEKDKIQKELAGLYEQWEALA